MAEKPEMFHDVRLLTLIGRYATPLAILLVSLGIIISQPEEGIRNKSLALLAFGIVFNLVFVQVVKRMDDNSKSWMAKVRLIINLAVNTLLIYLLGGFWPPMWLLLALTPIATAIYGSRVRTILMSVGVSAILLAVHALRGLGSPLEWGQQAAYAAFIILLSLMINELCRLAPLRQDS